MSAAGQWCCVYVLLVYDGCVEVDDKSSMRVLGGVWDVHWLIERTVGMLVLSGILGSMMMRMDGRCCVRKS